jgi:dTDP-4-amino-4,6-dideoxygalactose transaminase
MWHIYPIFLKDKARIFEILRQEGVGVQVNYVPANRHPVFAKSKIDWDSLRNSEKFYNEEISLPIYSGLSHEKIELVVKIITENL